MRRTLVLSSTILSISLLTALIGIPYQVPQLLQQVLFQDESINMPLVIKPAYATGTLKDVLAFPSNNIVSAYSFYHIRFTESGTSGLDRPNIHVLEVTFPAGFDVSQAKPIRTSTRDESQILCRSLFISGQTITCETGGTSYSGGTRFTLLLSNVQNSFSKNNQISVTTINQDGIIIDGPTNSKTFNLTHITNEMLADNAVTYTKIDKNAIDGSKIKNGSISRSDLNPSLVSMIEQDSLYFVTAKETANIGQRLDIRAECNQGDAMIPSFVIMNIEPDDPQYYGGDGGSFDFLGNVESPNGNEIGHILNLNNRDNVTTDFPVTGEVRILCVDLDSIR